MIKNLMKNILYTLVLISGMLIAGIAQVQAEVIVAASADTDQDAAAGIVSDASGDIAQDGSAGITADPSTDQDQDGSAGIVSNPSGDEDQDGAAGVVSSPSTDEDQDGHVPTTPGGTDNGGSNNGGTTSSGGGSSRNSRSSSIITTIATTSCPLITDYLKLDGANDALQVTKLQIFLNGSENAGLIVNGIFDEKTEAAVMNFQKKYMTDILGPWDATRATGFVYITTMKKINALACATPITLSADELAIIEAYKTRGGSDQIGAEIGSASSGSDLASTDESVGNDNVAAAANASILSRFWNFLKNLFR